MKDLEDGTWETRSERLQIVRGIAMQIKERDGPENWWRGLQEAVQELRDRKVGQPLAFEFLRRMEEHAETNRFVNFPTLYSFPRRQEWDSRPTDSRSICWWPLDGMSERGAVVTLAWKTQIQDRQVPPNLVL
eukprot:469156-Rhodomonas_salina.1